MIIMGLSGFLTGSTLVAVVTNSFNADAAGVLWTGFAPGVLILLGLGLSGLGLWGRKKIRHGTPVFGPYLALGMREVNLRGASLVQRTREGGEQERGMRPLQQAIRKMHVQEEIVEMKKQ